MRVLVVPILALLVLSGCADNAPVQDDATGPVDLSHEEGLVLVDLETREFTTFTQQRAALAWMSDDANAITWTEPNFAVVVDRSTGARDVGPLTLWARIYGNGTGLELAEGQAHLRQIVTGTILSTTPVPPSPMEGLAWTAASDDLGVLGGEYAVTGSSGCASDIVLRGDQGERTRGCHLKIASDGRAGWTEASGVRLRERNGTIVTVTPDPANATASVTVHENPVFTADGVLMLRVTGEGRTTLTEVVTREGEVVAKLDGPRRLALHDVSTDGRYLLVRAFGG